MTKEDNIYFENIAKVKVKCKCSHTQPIGKFGRAICTHCGNLIFRSKKDEFLYRLKEKENRI